MRPHLALGIDLDGVVCDFASAANEWVAAQMGVTPIKTDRWDWYLGYGEGVEEVWGRLWAEAVPDGLFLACNPIDGALDALDDLWSGGYTLVFCTARPMSAAVDTEAWLKMHGFGTCPLFVTADSRSKRHLGVDLLIDDKPETIGRHRADGRQAVLFKQPWNRDYWHKLPSVSGWSEVVELAEAMSRG